MNYSIEITPFDGGYQYTITNTKTGVEADRQGGFKDYADAQDEAESMVSTFSGIDAKQDKEEAAEKADIILHPHKGVCEVLEGETLLVDPFKTREEAEQYCKDDGLEINTVIV